MPVVHQLCNYFTRQKNKHLYLKPPAKGRRKCLHLISQPGRQGARIVKDVSPRFTCIYHFTLGHCFVAGLYFLPLITRNYLLSEQGKNELLVAQTDGEEMAEKKGWDRGSSVHPITVSGLISSNQIAQLNISKADSP